MLDLITQSQIWNFLLEEVRSREIGLLVVSHTDSLLDCVYYRTGSNCQNPGTGRLFLVSVDF